MKIVLMIALFSIVQPTWQFLFKDFSTYAPPTTTTPPDSNYTCKGEARKWGRCNGFPSMQHTTDTCLMIRRLCSRGKALAHRFIDAFTLSSMPFATNTTYNVCFGSGYCLKRKKRQITFATPKRDLLIMIDESGSVGKEKFKKAKRIASTVVKLLCREQRLSLDRTRVAVMTFDSTIHDYLPFVHPSLPELNSQANELASYIKWNIKYNTSTHGSTCLNSALLYARDNVFTMFNGARVGEAGVVQEILLITDGCANCLGSQALSQAVEALDSSGIKIYVIGIALSNRCEKKLKILSSKGHCYHLFHFIKWDYDVDDLIKSLEKPPTKPNGESNCIQQFFSKNKICKAQSNGKR